MPVSSLLYNQNFKENGTPLEEEIMFRTHDGMVMRAVSLQAGTSAEVQLEVTNTKEIEESWKLLTSVNIAGARGEEGEAYMTVGSMFGRIRVLNLTGSINITVLGAPSDGAIFSNSLGGGGGGGGGGGSGGVTSTSATTTAIEASAASTTLVAANANRAGKVSIYYDGNGTDEVLYVSVGSAPASATDFTIKMGKNFFTYWEPPVDIYTGAIKGIWSGVTGAGSANVTEYL